MRLRRLPGWKLVAGATLACLLTATHSPAQKIYPSNPNDLKAYGFSRGEIRYLKKLLCQMGVDADCNGVVTQQEADSYNEAARIQGEMAQAQIMSELEKKRAQDQAAQEQAELLETQQKQLEEQQKQQKRQEEHIEEQQAAIKAQQEQLEVQQETMEDLEEEMEGKRASGGRTIIRRSYN